MKIFFSLFFHVIVLTEFILNSENDALKAFHLFNGRYYGGRPINCSFVRINLWKEAICGKYSEIFISKK